MTREPIMTAGYELLSERLMNARGNKGCNGVRVELLNIKNQLQAGML